MAEDKKNVAVSKDTKDVSKPKITIADTVRELGPVGAKDRAELATKVVAFLNKKGITKNIKGKTITPEHVTAQIGAIIGCILTERGKNKTPQGWWSTYKVEETDTWLKILPKK
jgi:hypothetical protein